MDSLALLTRPILRRPPVRIVPWNGFMVKRARAQPLPCFELISEIPPSFPRSWRLALSRRGGGRAEQSQGPSCVKYRSERTNRCTCSGWRQCLRQGASAAPDLSAVILQRLRSHLEPHVSGRRLLSELDPTSRLPRHCIAIPRRT